MFLTGVVGFDLSSAAIGLSGTIARSIGLVIAFRALQGVFGAMLQPTALALLRNAFPLEKLSWAIGIWGAVIGASTAAGPSSAAWSSTSAGKRASTSTSPSVPPP